MAPREPGNNYFQPDADNPPFTAGSSIVLSAAGAEGRRGFRLYGTGSAPIGSKPQWTLEKGKDLTLDWVKDLATYGTKVAVELTVDQHGMSPLSLTCEFDDLGAATIPAAVIDQLLNSGVSGFPNGKLFRRTADHIDTETGCIEFLVGSPIAASVSVVGHIPCKKPADCPTGKTCNLTLERCE
jgi:hypothetical protein